MSSRWKHFPQRGDGDIFHLMTCAGRGSLGGNARFSPTDTERRDTWKSEITQHTPLKLINLHHNSEKTAFWKK